MQKTFADFLKTRLAELGYATVRNHALIDLMAQHKHDMSRQRASTYMNGKYVPAGENLEVLLDALELTGDARDEAYALCGVS